MKNKQLGTRHSEELLESIAQKAKDLGMNTTELVDWTLSLINTLDIQFLRGVQKISNDTGILSGDFIQRLLVGFTHAAYKKEREGENLDLLEKAILIKCRVGQVWKESDEYKRETEFQRYIEENSNG